MEAFAHALPLYAGELDDDGAGCGCGCGGGGGGGGAMVVAEAYHVIKDF